MSDYDDDDDIYNSEPEEGSDSEDEEPKPFSKQLDKKVINKKIDADADDADADDADADDDDADDDQARGLDDEVDYDEVTEDEEDEEDEDDDDIDINEDGEANEEIIQNKTTKVKKPKPKRNLITLDEEDDEYDDDEENYLQKFDNQLIKNYVDLFHPECLSHNYEEIAKLSVVVKNTDGIIVDPLHKTIPYLTKYEKARVIGQRAKQIETGAKPLVKVPETIIDGYIIAELELREKKIPFIIRRPIPGGCCEYWNLRDLELITY
jgi:DNA-directed RNA polymerases I, II, and III subunit RPABC2